jgi:hypothetical protein
MDRVAWHRGTLLEVHHGFLVVVGPAKPLGLGFAGLLCVLSGHRELLGADGTWVWGIGRLWGVRLIFGWVQRQPWLSLAPKQQVDTGDQVLELLEGGIPELLVREQLLIIG